MPTSRDLPKRIRVDEETHKKLRVLKKREKKSMAQIVEELVRNRYNEEL